MENSLWHKKPAKSWNNALPKGNGLLGGMVEGVAFRESNIYGMAFTS